MNAIATVDGLTMQQIKDRAFRALVEEGEAQAYQLIASVLSGVGIKRHEAPNTSSWYRTEERFAGRLRAVLNKLAAEGAIVKIGVGEQLPAGYPADRTSVTYYSKEGYEKALDRYRAANEARDAEKARWDRIRNRLADGGFRTGSDMQLEAAAWESLLDQAGL